MYKITRTRELSLCCLNEVKFRLTDFPILYVKGKQTHKKQLCHQVHLLNQQYQYTVQAHKV